MHAIDSVPWPAAASQNTLGLWREDQIEGWKPIVRAVRPADWGACYSCGCCARCAQQGDIPCLDARQQPCNDAVPCAEEGLTPTGSAPA